MIKIKTILISILSLCAIVTIAMLSIEGIDYAMHYKTYHAIDKFFEETRTIRNKDKCYTNYASIFANRKKTFDKKKVSTPVAFSQDMYNKTFSSCTQFKNDLTQIKISENIPADDQKLLKKYLVGSLNIVDSLLDNLNTLYKCKSDSICLLNSKKLIEKKSAAGSKNALEGNLAAIEAQKRLSLNYFFKLVPLEKKYQQKLKDLDSGNNQTFGQSPLIH